MILHLKREVLDQVARSKGWVKADGTLHQRLMAKSLNLHESHVSRILDDKVRVTEGFALRLSQATGRSLDELFEIHEQVAS